MTPEQIEMINELKRRKQGGEKFDLSQFQGQAKTAPATATAVPGTTPQAATQAPTDNLSAPPTASKAANIPGITSSPDINALIARATGKNIGGRIGDSISILGGAKPNVEDDYYSKLIAGEAIKKQFKTEDGYASEDEIPQEMGGLPLKSVTNRGGRFIPTYGKPSAFNFNMDSAIEDLNGPDEEPNSGPINQASYGASNTPEIESDEITLDSLEEMKQQALDEGRDPDEVEAIYQENLSRLTQVEGDVTDLDLDESDVQYLIEQGFDPEQIRSIYEAAQKKKTAPIQMAGE